MTKKLYEAPNLEIEKYELDMSIASNCEIVVSNGPAMGDHEECSDYDEPFSMARSAPYNVDFYEDTQCDCYTTGGYTGWWTS